MDDYFSIYLNIMWSDLFTSIIYSRVKVVPYNRNSTQMQCNGSLKQTHWNGNEHFHLWLHCSQCHMTEIIHSCEHFHLWLQHSRTTLFIISYDRYNSFLWTNHCLRYQNYALSLMLFPNVASYHFPTHNCINILK